MVKNYEHYKPGTNSRGLPSRDVKPPERTNNGITLDPTFQKACEKASEKLTGVPGSHKKNRQWRKLRAQRGKTAWEAGLQKDKILPTKRQASKWARKMGAAYQAHIETPAVAEAAE
jgi:hypothetical protein